MIGTHLLYSNMFLIPSISTFVSIKLEQKKKVLVFLNQSCSEFPDQVISSMLSYACRNQFMIVDVDSQGLIKFSCCFFLDYFVLTFLVTQWFLHQCYDPSPFQKSVSIIIHTITTSIFFACSIEWGFIFYKYHIVQDVIHVVRLFFQILWQNRTYMTHKGFTCRDLVFYQDYYVSTST